MEITSPEIKETLNDLVLINGDRIAGYEKAIEDLKSHEDNLTKNIDLIMLFKRMITESREHKKELANAVLASGGPIAKGTTNSGKLYRAWVNVKAMVTGPERHSIIAFCEGGEEAAQSAYEEAINEKEIPSYFKEMIIRQKTALRKSHNEIKSLKEMIE